MPPQKRKAATPAAAAKKQKGGAQPGGGKPSNLQAAAKAEVQAKAAGKAATPSIASFLGQRRRDDVVQVPAKKHKPMRSQVEREWLRLKSFVMRDDNLRALKYHELYERLFDQFSDKSNPQHFYNVLLLAAVVQIIAIDTSICERGFSLMNLLTTAKRSTMGAPLLRMLMTICSLGAEWKDPSKIPVNEIIDEWRAQASRNRYEGPMWTAAALEAAAHEPPLSPPHAPPPAAADYGPTHPKWKHRVCCEYPQG